jgi:voltage-gated potassium channel
VLERARDDDRLSAGVDIAIISVIGVNVLAIVIETLPWVTGGLRRALHVLEVASVILFTVEYVLRLWTARYRRPGQGGMVGALRFAVSPAGLIDLMAIVPFYLPFVIAVDLRFVRVLRIARFLRLLKLGRYLRSVSLFGKVLRERRDELLITVMMTALLLLVASILMYYIEGEAQSDKFPNILSSLWWAVVTLTTIGYGDVVPVTGWGRLLSGLVAVMGIGLVAVPTGIVSSGFIEELGKQRKEGNGESPANGRFCPHCGQPLEEHGGISGLPVDPGETRSAHLDQDHQ